MFFFVVFFIVFVVEFVFINKFVFVLCKEVCVYSLVVLLGKDFNEEVFYGFVKVFKCLF